MNSTLLQTIQSLHKRAERLEHEAAELRVELARVAIELTDPETIVATYIINEKSYAVTLAEVDRVRKRLIKPRSDQTLAELALAFKIAEERASYDVSQTRQQLKQSIEASRQTAIDDGSALEDEYQAAVND